MFLLENPVKSTEIIKIKYIYTCTYTYILFQGVGRRPECCFYHQRLEQERQALEIV